VGCDREERRGVNRKLHPEVVIEIRFKTTAEGGRKSSVFRDNYSCPLLVGGEAFDCRIEIENPPLELGRTYELPVQFLSPDLALPLLRPGTPVTLWEGREIATGLIKKTLDRAD